MSRYYCGIDPGYRTGGVALVNGDWSEVHDLPVWTDGGVNTLELSHILNSVPVDFVIVEKQGARPMQGVSSAFKLGVGYGQILGTLALLQLKYAEVTPGKWKKAASVPADKDGARRIATRTFPKLAAQLSRKKDEHRAEALLMAGHAHMFDQQWWRK